MKKLFTLFALVLMLAAIIAVPTTASASGSCPLSGGSASAYCASACGNPYGTNTDGPGGTNRGPSQGSGGGSACYYYCYNSICQSGSLPQCCN